jgi:diguanylate cyclase (GGDEF)-like protein
MLRRIALADVLSGAVLVVLRGIGGYARETKPVQLAARGSAVEARLRGREQFHREVLDSLAAPTALLDAEGSVLMVNAAWRLMCGADPSIAASAGAADAVGSSGRRSSYRETVEAVHPPGQARAAWRGAQQVLNGAVEFRLDVEDRRGGEHRWYGLQIRPLTADGGGAVASYTDITANKEVEARLFHQATHDPLTGLANRSLLSDRLIRAVASVRREGALAVLFVDLDSFKLINDSYGHHAGDDLLRQVAARLQHATRPQDTVARFAGDEFVVLCEGLHTELPGFVVAERILHALSPPFHLRLGLVTVTASVGVALCEASDLARADEDDHAAWTDAEALLQAADTAMFAAKVKGPGRYEVYSDALHSQARERLELTEALRRALPAGDLLLHYQPLADLDTGAVVGLEALTRLQLPDGAVRPAADFIDLAEDIGLIVEIDRWALATAAEQAAAWARAGHPLPRLAVNASASRLADPRLVTDVVAALARVPESFELCLEITEHAIMDRRDHVIPVLRQLHDLGVLIALDDFGTGHSSLAYLQQFPVDVIKLDRSFLAPVEGQAPDDRLIGGLLELAGTLDLAVVVEGIETIEQLRRLRDVAAARGSTVIGQGYLLAPPAPQPAPPARVQLPNT